MVTILKEEYDSLKQARRSLEQIDGILHQKKSDDSITRTYGVAKNKTEALFTKEMKDTIAHEHTPLRSQELARQL